jgi:hypothetical protein
MVARKASSGTYLNSHVILIGILLFSLAVAAPAMACHIRIIKITSDKSKTNFNFDTYKGTSDSGVSDFALDDDNLPNPNDCSFGALNGNCRNYRQISTSNGYSYKFNEVEANKLGYTLSDISCTWTEKGSNRIADSVLWFSSDNVNWHKGTFQPGDVWLKVDYKGSEGIDCTFKNTKPTCTPGAVCRAAVGDCDVPEVFDGNCGCPADAVKPAQTVCRASKGVCDAPEVCDGTSKTCVADGFKPSGTECQGASDVCEKDAYCTGDSAACPANEPKEDTVMCRGASDVCEKDAYCTGDSASCPANEFQPDTFVCRPLAGVCDVIEECTGSSAECPPDEVLPIRNPCDNGAGECDGTGVDCDYPPDCGNNAPMTCLWPPDHQFVPITIEAVTGATSITATGVTSDEPTSSINGAGGEAKWPDAILDPLQLRLERSGLDKGQEELFGRVYEITFTAEDDLGQTCVGTRLYCVPHDESEPGKACECINDGQIYDATQENVLACASDSDCDDGNICTTDTCQKGVCEYKDNKLACDDGDPCTEQDTCDKGVCAGTPKTCASANECAISDGCDPLTGACLAHNAPEDTPCNNGAGICNGSGICETIGCQSDGDCDDGNVCTTDTCKKGECLYRDNKLDCDDGDACTEQDTCDNGVCAGTAKICASTNECVISDGCDLLTGGCLSHNAPEDTPCNNGAGSCDASGTCVATGCLSGSDCDDGNACTTDTCKQGVCEHSDLSCTGNNECIIYGCDPATGCTQVFKPAGTSCGNKKVCDGSGTCIKA